jgi:hypothetical protein
MIATSLRKKGDLVYPNLVDTYKREARMGIVLML